ncbi:MAG TPA: hypothetical protein PLI16_06720 [Bacteroidales bacterium]|nr:hypothetical protein [Bacteroidales bacterium]
MENLFSKVVSAVFQPVFMPVYTYLLIYNIDSYISFALNPSVKILLFLMILFSTVILPVLVFVIFKRNYVISSFHMKTNEERNYPYLVTALIYFGLYLLLSKTALPPIYGVFFMAATVLSLVLLFINLRFKISAHMAGIGGVSGLLAGIAFRWNLELTLPVIIAIACAGLVGYARLKLNAHKPSEVYFGFLAGVSGFLLFTLLL